MKTLSLAFAFAVLCADLAFGELRSIAWSSDWFRVSAANGVKDDFYPLQHDPDKCSFTFRLLRHADNSIGLEAFVHDDVIVTDDSPPGSISCQTWRDDCLEVFFDGDNDCNPNTRGPDWNENPTPCNAGGEYAIAANGATQSDYASAKKCFGSLWGGFAEPWLDGARRIGTHYRLWFDWKCLNRQPPRPDEVVPLRMTVCIHDDDDGGACDYALYWRGNPKYPFADESAFGEVRLGSARWPFIVVRHTSAINDKPTVFNELADCHLRIHGACDEFWFAGGGRQTLDIIRSVAAKLAAFRPLCERSGVALSYQQGLTLGHGASHDGAAILGGCALSEDAWQCDESGNRIYGVLCPRSPEVLAHQRNFVKTVVETARPASYWLDDDLRLGIHKPNGCFCDRCVAAFNAKTGGKWSRKSLAEKMFSKSVREQVRAAWLDFNAESLAIYAAASRQGVEDAGVPCRLGYQAVWADTIYTGRDFRPLLEALSGPNRNQVGIRPGAGFYVEAEPRGMVKKCLSVAREAERCRSYGDLVASVCYEQETYPRRVLHKSPGAIMTECALALASGCNALSLYWYSASEPEPVEEYERFLKTLAAARPYFELLAESTRRTRLAGVARFVGSAAAETASFDLRDAVDFDLACAGVPITVMEAGFPLWYVTDKSLDEMTDADKEKLAVGTVVDVKDMGKYPLADRRKKLLDDIDAATGGNFPVRIDACRPLRILPRVRPDGTLDSVTILNLSIGDTDEIRVRLRRPAARKAVWRDAKGNEREMALAPGAAQGELVVRLPWLGGWGIGTIFLE